VKRFLAYVLTVATTLLVAGNARAADQPYIINVVLPITGGGALLGTTEQKTLELLETQVNKQGGIRGRPVKFAFLDDQSSPQVDVQLANQVLASKPAVVIGSGIAAMCDAMRPVFERAKILQWCTSPTFYPAVGGYVYASLVGSKDLMLGQVRFMREKGMKRIAILASTDLTGRTGETELGEILKMPENKGLTLVGDEKFAPNDVGVSAQVAKLKATNPDALVVWTAGTPFGTALAGLRDGSFPDVPVFASSANMIYSQITGMTSALPKTLYFQGFAYTAGVSRSPEGLKKIKDFQNALATSYLHLDTIAGIAWDPGMIVIDALRAVGPDATGDQLRSWVVAQKNYAGISGIYNFSNDMHGLGVDDMLVVRWDKSKSRWITASKFGGSPL
jgi:branched-chain amino acid transport system substrate-binding protein